MGSSCSYDSNKPPKQDVEVQEGHPEEQVVSSGNKEENVENKEATVELEVEVEVAGDSKEEVVVEGQPEGEGEPEGEGPKEDAE